MIHRDRALADLLLDREKGWHLLGQKERVRNPVASMRLAELLHDVMHNGAPIDSIPTDLQPLVARAALVALAEVRTRDAIRAWEQGQ